MERNATTPSVVFQRNIALSTRGGKRHLRGREWRRDRHLSLHCITRFAGSRYQSVPSNTHPHTHTSGCRRESPAVQGKAAAKEEEEKKGNHDDDDDDASAWYQASGERGVFLSVPTFRCSLSYSNNCCQHHKYCKDWKIRFSLPLVPSTRHPKRWFNVPSSP